IIIPPCFIGPDVILTNTVVGPHVSIGNNTILTNSIVSNSIIQDSTEIVNKSFSNSMIGSKVSMIGRLEDLSIGDYNQLVN
ncbi:MAG: glucose-1-phosphate thymidylyltransferase, partial [Chitinophagales bacterium]